MQVNGLTLRIIPIASASPSQDRETALLKWLLAEWERESNPVDIDGSGGIMHGIPEEKDTP